MHIFQLGPGNAYFVIQTVLLLQLLISGSIVREQWQCVSKLSANKTLFIILANSLDFAVDQLVNPHCRVKKKKKKRTYLVWLLKFICSFYCLKNALVINSESDQGRVLEIKILGKMARFLLS